MIYTLDEIKEKIKNYQEPENKKNSKKEKMNFSRVIEIIKLYSEKHYLRN